MKKKINKITLLIVASCFISVITVLLINMFSVPMKTYHSDLLKITFDYPAHYKLEERFGEITLKNDKGEILIHRTGTNYSDLKSFFENEIKSDNVKKQIDKKYFRHNDLDFAEALVKYPIRPELDRKVYYIYKESGVHVVSTATVTLYPDLDRVAKSFRYEP